MNCACDKLFARAALTFNQDCRIGWRSAANEFENFAHARARSQDIVLQSNLRTQFLIFLLQTLPVEHVFECQAGNTGDGGHHLEVSFIEKAFRVGAVEVNGANHIRRSDERHTNNGMHLQFLQTSGLRRSGIFGDVADHNTDALGSDPLHKGAADADGVRRSVNAVPPDGGVEVPGRIEKHHGAALRGNDVEDEAEELPLQGFQVADCANARCDFQQRI